MMNTYSNSQKYNTIVKMVLIQSIKRWTVMQYRHSHCSLHGIILLLWMVDEENQIYITMLNREWMRRHQLDQGYEKVLAVAS